MNRRLSWKLKAILSGTMLVVAWAVAGAQSARPDAQPSQNVTAEQQKQLDQLKQLERRLQTDRDALHAAITQYGWDSDQTDAAQDQLIRDRTEYRKLRRSLRSAGVAVPPPASMGLRGGGPGTGRPGSGTGRMHHGRRHHSGMCNCPCGY